MANDLTRPGEDLDQYGPAMAALTMLQRAFVTAAMDHPTYSATQLAEAAGYTKPLDPKSAQLRVVGHRLMHDPRILAAMDEEANKRMRHGGVIGVNGVVAIALNSSHRDHLKACIALMNRTGRHEMTEHKVIVDDKRPETRAELVSAVKKVAAELGLDDAAVKKLVGPDVVDAEFSVVDAVDVAIAQQMEDL